MVNRWCSMRTNPSRASRWPQWRPLRKTQLSPRRPLLRVMATRAMSNQTVTHRQAVIVLATSTTVQDGNPLLEGRLGGIAEGRSTASAIAATRNTERPRKGAQCEAAVAPMQGVANQAEDVPPGEAKCLN